MSNGNGKSMFPTPRVRKNSPIFQSPQVPEGSPLTASVLSSVRIPRRRKKIMFGYWPGSSRRPNILKH